MNMDQQIFKTIIISLICICSMSVKNVQAQQRFRVVNRALDINKATGVVHLNEEDSVGIAWISGLQLTTGKIEFDVRGVDKYQGSFVGLAFHGLNDSTYECIYFRPFNFRATDSLRRSHAIQYISKPAYDWPTLRERFPGKYERSIPDNVDPNGWFHVSIRVLRQSVSVYINGSRSAVFQISPLSHTGGKMVGYWVGHGSGGYWKNLKVTPTVQK